VINQTALLKSQIDAIKVFAATNPTSLNDVQDYDNKNNTQFYNIIKNQSPRELYSNSMEGNSKSSKSLSKEMIVSSLDEIIRNNEQKISDINNSSTGFWTELPPWSTLLLTGLGIFLTSLITNFGIFCSQLISQLRKWIFKEVS
jgi:hypothetical protein